MLMRFHYLSVKIRKFFCHSYFMFIKKINLETKNECNTFEIQKHSTKHDDIIVPVILCISYFNQSDTVKEIKDIIFKDICVNSISSTGC